MGQTVLLSASDLRRSVDLRVLAEEMRAAMGAYTGDGRVQRVRVRSSDTVTSMILAPGTARGVPVYTVKVNAKNPDRRPAVTGVVCVLDSATGDLLALMDSGWLTAARTGMGAAIGTDELAVRGRVTVGVVGAGVQVESAVRALARLRPLEAFLVHDVEPAASDGLARRLSETLRVPGRALASATDVVRASNILMVAPWGRQPVVFADAVTPGTHVTSLGSDEPGKQELDAALLEKSFVVVDDARLASAVLPRADATIGQVLRGERPGRSGADQLTVYSPVGLPMQDCVVAWHAYQAAIASGTGRRVDLER